MPLPPPPQFLAIHLIINSVKNKGRIQGGGAPAAAPVPIYTWERFLSDDPTSRTPVRILRSKGLSKDSDFE